MPDVDLVSRVEMLEKNVESLRKLPSQVRSLTRRVGRVETQILQLRTEMREEFSAVRGEMATKVELTAGLTSLRDELRTDIAGMGRDLGGAITELGEGQTRLRVLIEDIHARLRLHEEGDPGAP